MKKFAPTWQPLEKKELSLECIRTDGGTQPRVELQQEVLLEYRDKWEAGVELPPIDVFFDGSAYWLADGFHRFYGAREARRETIPALVYEGTVLDAVLFSCGANADHGLRRTNADKRRAVETLLAGDDWGKWSNRKIAEVCRVTHTFVNGIRCEVETVSRCDRIGKDGKTYTMPSTKPAIDEADDITDRELDASTEPVIDSDDLDDDDPNKHCRQQIINEAATGDINIPPPAVISGGTAAEAVASAFGKLERRIDDSYGKIFELLEAAGCGDAKQKAFEAREASHEWANEALKAYHGRQSVSGGEGDAAKPDWKDLLGCIAKVRRAADTINVMTGRRGQLNSDFQDTCGILDQIVRDWRVAIMQSTSIW